MAKLYIVATPIGNMEDITRRALDVLEKADLVLCEDTRVTKKIFLRYGIKTPLLSYHQHSKVKRVEEVIEKLREGKNLALVSDAGTPGISDPGNKLIEKIKEELKDKVEIKPVPGPSALTAAVSVSGFPSDSFLFLGFPPSKRKRKVFFKKVLNSEFPVIFYESPHRILKTLKELKDLSPDLDIVLLKELTKKFEKIWRGKIRDVLKEIDKEKIRGEFVVIVKR